MTDYKSIETWFSTRFENLFNTKRKESGIPSIKIATVYSVGTGVASVTLPNDAVNIIPNIKIGTGVSVVAGDTVYLMCMNGDIGNSYILANKTMATTAPGVGGAVVSVAATSPVLSSGGINPTISIPAATSTVAGYATSAQIAKLDGIATGANNYAHPSNHPASVITQDTSNRFVTDTEKATWNAKEPAIATDADSKFFSGTKAWRDLATDVRNSVLTGLSVATSTVVVATDNILVSIGKLQAQITTHIADAIKHITATERTNWGTAYTNTHAHTNASILNATTASFLTADETKLDGIATGANLYVHPSTDGTLHVPATGTTNNGKILTAGATAGSVAWANIGGMTSVEDQNMTTGIGDLQFWTGTQAEYDAIVTKNPSIYYIITDATETWLTAYNKDYGTTQTDVKMNGTQSVGTVDAIARIDHVHPTDTTIATKEPANANIQAHVTSAHAPSNAQKNSDVTKAEIEAKLIGAITTHTHAVDHTHSNKAVLDATTASFLITDETKLDGLVTNATHTGQVTGATTLTIADATVTNANLAHVATATIKGRVTASSGDPEDLTATQVRTLLNVADGANNYTHPSTDGNLHVPATSTTNNGKVLTAGATAGSLSWVTPPATGVTSVTGTSPVVSSGGNTPAISIPAATASVNGYATSTQIAKLDGIATGANNYVHPAGTNPHSTTATDVGLGNVTNESKATMFTNSALTGVPTAPTATVGTNNTQIATTAFVLANAGSGTGSGIEEGLTPPVAPAVGDLWLDTSNSAYQETVFDALDTKIDNLPTWKNKIINGNFDIWQRGTSQTATGYGSADRWHMQIAGGTTASRSRQTFPLGQTDVPGNPTYFLRNVVVAGTGASDLGRIFQAIEYASTLAGKTATLSFYAKADSVKNIAVEYTQYSGAGGTGVYSSAGVKFAIGTTWTKITIMLTLPSIAGYVLGTGDSLNLGIWFDSGSTYDARTGTLGHQSGTFDIAQVQLEEGSVATAFEQRPVGLELGLCQRYYQVLKNYAVKGQFYSSTACRLSARLISEMRVPPTLTLPSNGATTVDSIGTGNKTGGTCSSPTCSTSTVDFDVSLLTAAGVYQQAMAQFDIPCSAEL